MTTQELEKLNPYKNDDLGVAYRDNEESKIRYFIWRTTVTATRIERYLEEVEQNEFTEVCFGLKVKTK